jgi:histidine triad (HIT) family protein
VLIIPKKHYDSVNALDDAAVMGELTAMAKEVAKAEGVAANGYRLVVNTGRDGGQSVGHLHMHLLAGRSMGWPPG